MLRWDINLGDATVFGWIPRKFVVMPFMLKPHIGGEDLIFKVL